MSATLPAESMGQVSRWLRAAPYCTLYRPVALRTRICVDRVMHAPRPATGTGEGLWRGRPAPPCLVLPCLALPCLTLPYLALHVCLYVCVCVSVFIC
jgi:hypothetical protein